MAQVAREIAWRLACGLEDREQLACGLDIEDSSLARNLARLFACAAWVTWLMKKLTAHTLTARTNDSTSI